MSLAANPNEASFSLTARFARIFLISNQLDQREQSPKKPPAWNAARAWRDSAIGERLITTPGAWVAPPRHRTPWPYQPRRTLARAPFDLKVSSALAFRMSNWRRLGLLVLESRLAVRASALRALDAGTPDELGVADRAVAAEMAGDGEIVDSANRVLRHSTLRLLHKIPSSRVLGHTARASLNEESARSFFSP